MRQAKKPHKEVTVPMLKEAGRGLARTISPFFSIERVIDDGTTMDSDASSDELSETTAANLKVYKTLTETIPALHSQLLMGTDSLVDMVKREIASAFSHSISTDVNVLKSSSARWLSTPENPINPKDKAERGFANDATGRLLCPHTMDWDDPSVKEKLRDRLHVVKATPWPNFLFEKNECLSLELLFDRVLRGPYFLQAWERVYLGTDPTDDDACDIRITNRSKASRAGLEQVTPASIAYVAVLLRSALSKDPKFATTVKGGFDYRRLYAEIIEWFQDVTCAEESKAVLDFWNARFYPHMVKDADDGTAATTKDLFAEAKRMRQEKAAAAAALASISSAGH